LLAACDSTVTNTNDDAKAEGNITIMVVDNHSGAALSGVTVYSVTDDKAVVGDSLGRSVWKSVPWATTASRFPRMAMPPFIRR
jgi:hypothetical protein